MSQKATYPRDEVLMFLELLYERIAWLSEFKSFGTDELDALRKEIDQLKEEI